MACLIVFCWLAGTSLAESPADAPAEPLPWMTNYGEAMQAARAAGKMLFIYFYADSASDKPNEFETSVLSDESIRQSLKPLVLAKIPTTATGQVDGKQIKLLDHAAYADCCTARVWRWSICEMTTANTMAAWSASSPSAPGERSAVSN